MLNTLVFFAIISIIFLCYYSYNEEAIWSIGIYTGTNPYKFTPHPLVSNTPVLAASDVNDVSASFVADPFMINEHGKWYMFFEVLNTATAQGDIGLSSSENGINWKYERIVLDEPFHLSYPYVFRWNDSYYMIPESRKGNAVKLYKATEFPIRWSFVKDLIVGSYADPSIVYKDNKWWLFVLRGYDTLTLFYADSLTGPWIEHPMSPLVKGDKNIARPGGRCVIFNDKIIRYVQDGEPTYGNAVRVFEVDSITSTKYEDHEIKKSPILKASGRGWNSIGMHHVDPHQLKDKNWIICVDGKAIEKDFNLIVGAKQILYDTKKLLLKFKE